MGKRSDFPRRKQDTYDTPPSALEPLLAHLPPGTRFAEPCAGAGRLANALEVAGHIPVHLSDIITGDDALLYRGTPDCDYIITNPPWTRQILHPLINHLRKQHPTWLLLDADWMHTQQSAPYMPYCRSIVSVGRVSWMENKISGKDNCVWYLFMRSKGRTTFHGRSI